MTKKRPQVLKRTLLLEFEETQHEDSIMEALLNDMRLFEKEIPAPLFNPNSSNQKSKSWKTTPDDALDLHGETLENALKKVQNFIVQSIKKRFNVVLIITGKGLHSGYGGPILKTEVATWLKSKGKPYIRDFRTAPPQLGGDGAFWIELR
ncbi:Smr/MutS family protein [Deltaproteobacteria bacterium TL4]